MDQPAVTTLARLRKRLARLRRRRRRVRLGTGYCALLLALLWLLGAAFLFDWTLELSRLQRIVALAVCLAALGWAFRRFTRPWLGQRETELDMALLLQCREHIDSDLVAAIQFESPEAAEWGSVALERKVVENVGQMGDRLDVIHAVSHRELRRRGLALGITSVVLALAVLGFPDHAATFLDRFFLLGARHYPTRTIIETVRINGRPVRIAGWRPEVAKSPCGRPVRFEVTCSGVLPVAGRADLTTDRGVTTSVALGAPAAASGSPERPGVYVGELPRLVDAVDYQVHLGDARTDPARLEVVPLSAIDVALEVTPPPYVSEDGSPASTHTRLRQVAVIEGSRVRIRALSDKPLRTATLVVDGQAHPMHRERDEGSTTSDEGSSAMMQPPSPSHPSSIKPKPSTLNPRPSTSPADSWTLDPDDTRLAAVVAPVRYEVRAVDTDGLEPERAIEGIIRIKADQGPRVAASAITEYALPVARPRIAYEASDDYGLALLAAVPEVTHEDGTVETLDEVVIYRATRRASAPRELQDRYPLDLGPLELVKGDRLAVTLRAVDYRGPDREGKQALSEPLLFQVTDQRGILAAMTKADREAAGRLKSMIQGQIEVGERQ